MKKLFFLNSCREWGGGEKWTLEVAQKFNNKEGFEVVVGSVKNSELLKRAQNMGIKTRVVPVKGSLSVLNFWRLISFANYLKKRR
ncbi:hypothetical protein [Halothermothrix orenii]|uniref:hypothetical protein n=1 Tax=Halothermothrix orenii TaxID=31909 RepID=UPI00006AD0BF|nr:hypothetical protein [Halothermothrix orenii]